MNNLSYKQQLTLAMDVLSKKEDTLFLGQAVGCHGTFMYDTYADVPKAKRLEFPVCESFQLQFSIGLAMNGYCPISIFPRWNFLLLATADIINTLDKLRLSPIIIRTAVGTSKPIYPGDQHVGDFTIGFRKMLYFVDVVKLEDKSKIIDQYLTAYDKTKQGISSIMVEVADLYDS